MYVSVSPSAAVSPGILAMGRRRRGASGIGDAQAVVSGVQMGGSAFMVGSAVAIQTGAIASTGAFAAVIPVIGPIIAGVCLALSLIFGRKGPKQKRATTAIVNDVEPQVQKNLAGYLALNPRYRSAQAQALANFDAAWQWIVQNCGQSSMGDPGKACIKDRQSGACTWRDAGGQCWNWFSGYRDPIANDTTVVDDPVINAGGFIIDLATNRVLGPAVGVDAGTAAAASAAGLSSLPDWVLPVGLVAAVWAVAGGREGKS